MNIYHQKLTSEDVHKNINANDRLQFVVPLDLEEIIGCAGIDGMNEIVDDFMPEGYILSDISYEVVGFTRENTVLIQVTADFELY